MDSEIVWEGTEDSSWIDKGALFDCSRSILENTAPAIGLREALQLHRIMAGFYASARSGAPISMLQQGGSL